MQKSKKKASSATSERSGIKSNILYTGKGDKGTTTLYHCNQQRISKSANIIEALGALDELNAYLGVVKVHSDNKKLKLLINKKNFSYVSLVDEIQQMLFVIQAELAGSDMSVKEKDLKKCELIINTISLKLPPLNAFTISGRSLINAELDFARTLARRAERRVIAVEEEGMKKMNLNTIAYLNRLSSVLFALSRYSNCLLSIPEEHPTYNKE